MEKMYDQLDIDERYEIYRLRETSGSLREIGRMMSRSGSRIAGNSRAIRCRGAATGLAPRTALFCPSVGACRGSSA
jgi:IS30 family transposase